MSENKFQFDTAMAELEQITQWFEASEIDLDQGLTKFERGMELATELKEHLAKVENRVEKIKAKFGDQPARSSRLVEDAPTFDDDDAPANLFD